MHYFPEEMCLGYIYYGSWTSKILVHSWCAYTQLQELLDLQMKNLELNTETFTANIFVAILFAVQWFTDSLIGVVLCLKAQTLQLTKWIVKYITALQLYSRISLQP